MRVDAERWEHGSDFAYPDLVASTPGDASGWLPPNASYWHSGRHALQALLQTLAPRRVFFPSFYCQDVLAAAPRGAARCYAESPLDDMVDLGTLGLGSGDVLVVSNTHGLRHESPLRDVPADVIVVEDHTHDPLSRWARSSKATYAFASLRKWFPIPDGAMLWSPCGAAVPSTPADTQLHASTSAITLDRLTGMLLKERYLSGAAVDKEAYRSCAIAGEEAIGRGPSAPISIIARTLLELFPAFAWHRARCANHVTFVRTLGQQRAVRALGPIPSVETSDDFAPYAVTLLFDDPARRDAIRSALVSKRIYPAVLWPIDPLLAPGIPEAHAELARRILCLHCDHRYDEVDMRRASSTVRDLLASM